MKTSKPPVGYHRTQLVSNVCVQCPMGAESHLSIGHHTGLIIGPWLCPMLQCFRLAPWMMLPARKEVSSCVQCSNRPTPNLRQGEFTRG